MVARRRVPKRYLMSLLVLCTLTGILMGCSGATGSMPGTATIVASKTGSLSDSFPLDGQSVTGELHVFVAGATDAVDFVEFAFEPELGDRQVIRRDYHAPYTPTPDGTPLNLQELGVGKQVMVADVLHTDGTKATAKAEFVVADPAAPEPAPDPLPPEVPGEPAPPEQPGEPAPPEEPGEPAPPEEPAEPAPTVWQPRPGTSWQWQLTGRLDMSVDAEVFDIDLEGTSAATIAELHAAGRHVICYFSAGSFEPFRGDAGAFPESVKGKKMYGWDELWLDIRQVDQLAPVMLARMDMAAAKGCDAVEPDNIDAYQKDSGFPLSGADQLAYNRWLAAAAHERGLAIALKNDLGQVRELVDHFDFAINEECFSWNECHLLRPFIDAGKAVFGAEYDLSPEQFCGEANAMDMDFIHKELNLGAYRRSCR